MNLKFKHLVYGLFFGFLIFLSWEWYNSFPKVRWLPPPFPKTQTEKIDSILIQSLSEFLIPGLSVGIVEDGKLTYLKSFGYENLERKDSMKLDSEMPVASISKPFTALAVAEYFGEKELSAEAKIETILTEKENLPEGLGQLTISQLLTHSSGLKDPNLIRRLGNLKNPPTLSELPLQLGKVNFNSAQFEYADVNYDLIGYLLQSHSGIDFDSLITVLTLHKAGMSDSYFPKTPTNHPGHTRTFPWKRIKTKSFSPARIPSPSSGLVVTAQDLSKFLLHLSRGKMSDFQSELKWLKTPSGVPAGFQTITIAQNSYLGHFGEEDGFSGLILFSQDWENSFFLLTNSRDHSDHRVKISFSILHILDQDP